jgi:histidyl-tRNA synthetase
MSRRYRIRKREIIEMDTAKGVIDFGGEDGILREEVITTLKKIFELYGYNPLQTPIIERWEILSYKQGDETSHEIFRMIDRGGRRLGLRFDQTVPLARFVAMHSQTMNLPYKRYEIGPVFRDGPVSIEQGRYRTFTQCDVDVIGIAGMAADAEVLALASDVFRTLQLGAVDIKINNRKLLNGVVEQAGVDSHKALDVILSMDKLDKLGVEGVTEELIEKGINKKSIDSILSIISMNGENDYLLNEMKKIVTNDVGKKGIKELGDLLAYSKALNLSSVKFDPSLARGLAYYTSTTFEVYLKDRSIISSAITAGGRFDDMVGLYAGQGRYPAVGISFGLERICQVIKAIRGNKKKNITELYVIPIGKENVIEGLKIAMQLRNQGLNVDIELVDRSVRRAIEYVDAVGIPYIGFVGESELQQNRITLRSQKTKEQKTIKIDDVYSHIRNE